MIRDGVIRDGVIRVDYCWHYRARKYNVWVCDSVLGDWRLVTM